jgi:hypothetical protein
VPGDGDVDYTHEIGARRKAFNREVRKVSAKIAKIAQGSQSNSLLIFFASFASPSRPSRLKAFAYGTGIRPIF